MERRPTKGRRGHPAGPSAVLAVALLLSACAVGDEPETSSTPRRDLAVTPEPLAPATSAPSAAATASDAPTAAATTSRPGTTASAAVGSPAPSAVRPVPAPAGEGPYRPLVTLTDPRADHGTEGPAYADVVAVRLEDDGTRLRATVRTAGALPATPAEGEVFGVGVDLYDRSGEFESDYQLFADGGSDGWFAYLSTPKGFVRYPGRFSIAGDQLVFTVPWSAVGGRRAGWTKAFADWTRTGGGTLGGNRTANDRAPLVGSTGYRL